MFETLWYIIEIIINNHYIQRFMLYDNENIDRSKNFYKNLETKYFTSACKNICPNLMKVKTY